VHCGLEIDTERGVIVHELRCHSNPNRKPLPKQSWTEEMREHQRKTRKQFLALHPEKNVPFVKRQQLIPTDSEKWLRNVIETHLSDKDYVSELRVKLYKLDFAWRHKQICVEMDGTYHDSEAQRLHDIKRDEELSSLGWRILRVRWSDCVSNPDEQIQRVRSFVESSPIVPEANRWKSRSEIKELRYKNAVSFDSRGYYNSHILPESVWQERLSTIQKYDMSRFGWMKQACHETGLTKSNIWRTCEHFGIDYRSAPRKNSPRQSQHPSLFPSETIL
jgi:very-short-patch-repair endonuclease